MGVVITIPADRAQPIRSRETMMQPSLQELQDIVDGSIETVPHWDEYMGSPCVVYCNKEGKLHEPVNERATGLWYAKLGQTVDAVLCGDVVLVVGLPDKDGDEDE